MQSYGYCYGHPSAIQSTATRICVVCSVMRIQTSWGFNFRHQIQSPRSRIASRQRSRHIRSSVVSFPDYLFIEVTRHWQTKTLVNIIIIYVCAITNLFPLIYLFILEDWTQISSCCKVLVVREGDDDDEDDVSTKGCLDWMFYASQWYVPTHKHGRISLNYK